jgi:hypothetical protein
MSLTQWLGEHIAAAFSGIWIHSFEHQDAMAETARLCCDRGWSFAARDLERGLSVAGLLVAGQAVPECRHSTAS